MQETFLLFWTEQALPGGGKATEKLSPILEMVVLCGEGGGEGRLLLNLTFVGAMSLMSPTREKLVRFFVANSIIVVVIITVLIGIISILWSCAKGHSFYILQRKDRMPRDEGSFF